MKRTTNFGRGSQERDNPRGERPECQRTERPQGPEEQEGELCSGAMRASDAGERCGRVTRASDEGER